MNDDKKVTIDVLKKHIEEAYKLYETVNADGLIINVRTHIGLSEMVRFVNDVVNSCFGEDDEFMPEARDFAIRSCVFTYYTNIELPEDMNERYDLLYSIRDAYYAVLDTIDKTQIIEMCKAIDEKVENKTQNSISEASVYTNQMLSKLDDLISKFESAFSGVSAEDISEAVKTLASGEIDENDIIKAYLNNARPEWRNE